ncbi:MAG: hypothetical protein CMM10_18100, partial [Rhodospirillaceae bacterium]|nr:hypothetical protein [Rhodospirillaceae bacterium]
EPIGNLEEEAIEDMWNGEAVAKFRSGVNDPKKMNSDCINCTHCRHRSLTRREVNDFSESEACPTGLIPTCKNPDSLRYC